ncbi:hypothetical protein [Kallotenue papyrolyticum]|uniref:hypothetical protein n=1 Tax=Kallotenue papyrolyticum TaxID=1325125 RepID=UPI00047867CC|nr:hypothetical protein [Kallotenue papyrolyticum]
MNVDDLMREIEAAAAAAGPEPVLPHLELSRLMPQLAADRRVEPRPPLVGRSAYERLWARINRLIRRVAAHGVEPVVHQQNAWNQAAVEAIAALAQAAAMLRGAVVAARAARQAREHDHER